MSVVLACRTQCSQYRVWVVASASMTAVAGRSNPRHLGAEIGLVAVLHSWGQNLHQKPTHDA